MTLRVQGLSAERSGRTILYPTNVDFKPGERVGLVGASGSGKSTLGHELVDALRAQGSGVAHVPQSPDEALDPLRSMAFHWQEAERALGLAPGAVRRETLFQALRIEHGDLRKRPWGWSRGMQQRFVIAMALI
ncbi:MAG: ATP-binding cassette domain-containing protein, partial [Pseudomonadota bacterium]